MSRNKKHHYAAIQQCDNVYFPENIEPGTWNEKYFHNDGPITLELGCGKGDYVIALAQKYPMRNFVGIDIKGDRLYTGSVKAREHNLSNAIFFRAYIQFITEYFEKGEVDEIWITFPDPYPSNTKSRKRLTSPFFMNKYKQILKNDGIIHFKTDVNQLYEFTRETLQNMDVEIEYVSEDVHQERAVNEEFSIMTTYEKKHIADGKSIKYVRFKFRA